MKTQRKITFLITLLIIMIGSLIFPLQKVVFAEEPNKTMNFNGNNLVVNDDGSVTFDCDIEFNSGRITFTLYNSQNEIVKIQPFMEYDYDLQQDVPNDHEAWVDLGATSYEGFYLFVSSNDVNLTNIKLEMVGNYTAYLNEDNIIDLTPIEAEHINVNATDIRPLEDYKEIFLYTDNLTVNTDGSVSVDCNLEYNTGLIKVFIHNPDGTLARIENTRSYNEETGTYEINEHEARAYLNSTTFAGAWFELSSDVIKLDEIAYFTGETYPIGEDGKVYLPDTEYMSISNYSFVDSFERPRIQFNSENITFTEDGGVLVECHLEDNEGTLKVIPHNSDGSLINVRYYDRQDPETGEWGFDTEHAFGNVKGRNFDGAYLEVSSDEINFKDFKFNFSGKDCFRDEDGIVDLTGCEYVYLEDWSYKPLIEKKIVEFNSSSLQLNEGNTVSMDSEILGEEGIITYELHNADGSVVTLKNSEIWYEDQEGPQIDPTRAYGKLNSDTYEGAYLIITVEGNVDLSTKKLDIEGHSVEIDEKGTAYLPEDIDYTIGIHPWSLRENYDLVTAHFYYDEGLVVNDDGSITVPCIVKNNTGTVTLEFHNADGSIAKVKKTMEYNYEEDTYYESEKSAEAKFKTETYEGAYIIATSDDVDLENVRFVIDDEDYFIDEDEKIALDDVEFVYFNLYSMRGLHPEVADVSVNVTSPDAKILSFVINEVDFTDNHKGVNTINKTLEVERDITLDNFLVRVDPGRYIKTVTINGEVVYEEDEYARAYYLDFAFPQADSYTVEIESAEDTYFIPYIVWNYEDEELYEGDSLIEHGTVEVVSVTLPDGETVYDLEELLPVDDPGIGLHPKHEEAYFIDEEFFKELHAEAGSTVVLKIIPDEGYAVTSLDLPCGSKLTKDPNVENQYSFVLPRTIVFLKGIISDGEEVKYTGLKEIDGTIYYVKDNEIDTTFTGLMKGDDGNWYYVQSGRVDKNANTLVKFNGVWFYINKGMIDWSYTGLFKFDNSWFYIQNGELKWGVNTLVKYNGVWFYINNSVVDWSYTGLFKYSGTWFYIQNGQLVWGANTLVKYNGVWFYVNNSMVDWNYTSLFKFNDTWFYIQNGQLVWGVNTLVKYNGTWFYIKNSSIDWSYTGLFNYNGTWFYIQNGTINWGYTGTVTFNGGRYNVKGGIVV